MSQKHFNVSARESASLVGKIISAGAVFRNISRIMTRYCSISVAAAQDWREGGRGGRELTAIVFALESFLPLLKGSYIKWFSDSQNACRIIQVGSMRKDLHVIALKIFQFCVDNGIELELQWIPRTKIDRADFISRIIDVDDWQITTSFFEFLDYTWGLHTVDCRQFL